MVYSSLVISMKVRVECQLNGLGSTQGIRGAYFWVCVGGKMEMLLWIIHVFSGLFLSSTVLLLCLLLLWAKQLGPTMLFHQEVSVLKPGDHGLNPLNLGAKLNLSSFNCGCWVLYFSMRRLTNTMSKAILCLNHLISLVLHLDSFMGCFSFLRVLKFQENTLSLRDVSTLNL